LFPLMFWRSKGDELHAVLTVASSLDSLTGSPENFGSALLAPSLSGSGSIQGATIEYHSFNPLNKSTGTWGPRIRASFARSIWRVQDTISTGSSTTVETLRGTIPLTALDIGARFTFLNHLVDAKQNTFAVGLDASYLVRLASPNTPSDSVVVSKALKSTVHLVNGTGLAFWIRLRNVTATADFPYLRRGRGEPVAGLTGLQPAVTFRFSSALFTF